MLADFLNDKGIETKEFLSGEAYLNQMPSEGNQVVILDYYFDVDNAIDGLDVLKQIKKRNPEVLTLKDLAAGVYHTSIPINNLESGVYLIRFEVAGYTYISKIVKQ